MSNMREGKLDPKDDVDAMGPSDDKDDKQAQSSQDSILSRKLKKILDSDLDADSEMCEALAELSSFFADNTLRTRRFLRGDIERRSLQINHQFLEELTLVKDAVEDVHSLVAAMAENGRAMQRQLEATKSKTRDLIQQTTALHDEGTRLARHEAMISDFIARYQLTEEELETLKGSRKSQHQVSPEFFKVLDRVQHIHADCKKLLQSGQQTTALEIMEQMAALQEGALERLHRWTQSQCRTIDSSDNTVLLAQAMRHLQERPAMFKLVVDEYCASRRSLLVRAFIDALTVGGPNGTPRPIELHAHDPPRYVGDMLAWLHQAIPSENENIRSLLKTCDKTDIDRQSEEALSSITEDVCRPLKTRVEQILLLESEACVLYRLTNLVRFYASTIKQAIPSTGALVKALDDLDQLAYKQFLSVLQTTVHQHTSRAEPPRHDLAPTPSTFILLSLLRETLSGSSVIDEQQDQLQEIVAAIVDPLQDSLESLAASFPTTDHDVFMLNSLYQIHTTLSMFHFNDARLLSLQSDMQLHLDTLASEQTSNLIANLGLQPICTMVAEHMEKQHALAKVAGMDEEVLRTFLAKFDSFLVAPDVFLLPQSRLLVSSSHRKNIAKRSLEVVAASYSQLYHAVVDPKNLYENPIGLMPKSPEQVKLLLQL